MGTERKFQKNLQKLVTHRILLLVGLSALLFWSGQYAAALAQNQINATAHLEELERVFLRLLEQDESFLMDDGVVAAARRLLWADKGVDRPEAAQEFRRSFRQFDDICEIHNQVLVTDARGNILYTSLGEDNTSSYFLNYNNAVCYQANLARCKGVYRAVYFDHGNYGDTMFVRPVWESEVIVGYVTLFLSGSEWNFYLSESNFDGVITDERQNVMYISKSGLLESGNKFYGVSFGNWQHEGGRYWVASKELPDHEARIYALVYNPENNTARIGLLALTAMGAAWFFTAHWMSRIMAENNASSIERLVEEIRIIHRGDHSHRIELETDDEFSEVGYQVNHMLDNIQALNERNTELIRLNGRIEMMQLTAQMNPHFLYNTLETIRNLVAFDGPRAEELLVKLTEILRYSVDSLQNEVALEDDMSYICRYLDIQNCRFGERFLCEIDIAPECGSCIVPKLLLQPLIENSIKYGFRKRMDLHIEIKGRMEGHALYISVRDNGLGMEETAVQELSRHLREHDNSSPSIGLRNLSRRLYLRYGDGSGLEVRNREGVGFEVIARVEQGERKCIG